MRTEQDIDLYLNTVIKEGLYSSKGKLQFQMDTLFKGIDFKNKKVLDIGGGFGLYSFYAACRGAKKVVCLEPEAEGSSSGVTDKFHKLNKLLEHNNVELKPVTIQALEPEGETFDVILLYNSINHLDETACINLLRETKSKAIYQEILSKIYPLSNKGAKLIICDCSRYNFFALFKIRNPFDPTIEWHKHQAPEVWASLLGKAGFMNPKIRWSSFNRLGGLGRVLIGNKLMAYFLTSHFCITMDLKDQDESTADRGMDVRIARRHLLNNLKDIPLANNINMIRTSMKRSWKIGLSIVKYPPRFSFIPTTLHTDINRKAKTQ